VSDNNQKTVLTNQIDIPYYKHSQGSLPAADWKQRAKGPRRTTTIATISSSDETRNPEPHTAETQAETRKQRVDEPTPKHQVNPFHPRWVEEVLNAIKIRTNLTSDQREQVCALVRAYADCFALSVREVMPAQDTRLHLGIPADAQLSTKARQRTFTLPQRHWRGMCCRSSRGFASRTVVTPLCQRSNYVLARLALLLMPLSRLSSNPYSMLPSRE
jgi:hypothetical protein